MWVFDRHEERHYGRKMLHFFPLTPKGDPGAWSACGPMEPGRWPARGEKQECEKCHRCISNLGVSKGPRGA